MKKTILLLLAGAVFAAGTIYAQDKKKVETEDSKTKIKPNTTAGDKIHNVIHPKKKKSHGVKVKRKTDAGKVKAEIKPA